MVNTNKLIHNYSGCTGLKTGSTSLALYNLSASASRNGMDLIAVVMKAPTSKLRFDNCSTLLDYGFSNFEYKSLINKNDAVKNVSVDKGVFSSLEALAESDCRVVISKDSNINIEQTISIPNSIQAPISFGEVIGKITYTLNGNLISECNLIANKNISKINIFSMSKKILKTWVTLFR